MSVKLTVSADEFRLAKVFTISRGSRTSAQVVTATLKSAEHTGRGECVPYARYNESTESVMKQIHSLQAAIGAGMSRAELQAALPAGAARNALDCAMWDLQAKITGVPVWQRAGLEKPVPLITAYTLSLADPAEMQAAASEHQAKPLLKIKLGGTGDIERLRAVKAGAPSSRLIVDANEGWSLADYNALAPVMVELGVALVEQPLPAGEDGDLIGAQRPLPVCADEACHDRDSLSSLVGKYDFINIKLDKTGGLTEALALREAALSEGFKVMVGCMVGTSLAMAPAMLVAQGAEVVDLDGPLLLAEDRTPALTINAASMQPCPPELWG